jgi:hypothetical protein
MDPKVFVKLKKTLKTLSSGQKTQKKNQKTPKKPTAVFFFKPGFFPTLTYGGMIYTGARMPILVWISAVDPE